MGISPLRRKLQFAGNSSYVLTLPKQWIRQVKLDDPQSEVFIEELDDGSLRIAPVELLVDHPSVEEQVISVGENRSPNEVVRLILASYLASTPQIVVKSQGGKPLGMDHVMAINGICDKLWGAEIVEETEAQIVIHDALDPSQMKLQDLVQKSWFTARNMLEKSYKYLFDSEMTAKTIVHNAERTLDKLYYLALRQLYRASSRILFAHKIGIRPMEIIDYHLLVKNIERIGDHAEQLVSNKPDEGINVAPLKGLAELSKKGCEEAIRAFLTEDPHLADISIERKSEAKMLADSLEIPSETLPLTKSLLRIADYGSDIGELVLNRYIANRHEEEIREFSD